MNKKIEVLFFFLLAAWLLAGCKEEKILEAPSIQWSINIGFDNQVKLDKITPVFVSLQNRGITKELLVELSQNTSVVYSQKIKLPAPSRKQIVFYGCFNSSPIIFSITDTQSKKIIVSEKYGFSDTYYTDASNHLSFAQQDFWLNIQPRTGFKANVHPSQLQAANVLDMFLPDDPIGFESVKLVMLTNPFQTQCTSSQLQALQDWVEDGGTLIVADTSMHQGKNVYVLAPFFPKTPLSFEEEAYLKTSYGNGEIVWLRDSIEKESTRELLATEKFFYAIFPEMAKPKEGYSYSSDIYYFHSFLQRLLTINISLDWFFLFVFFYILCLGPLDYLFTRKSRRKMITWMLFSLVIILFSSLSYGITTLFRLGNMKIVVINCLDIAEDAHKAIGRTFFGIYSTQNATYDISSSQQSITFATSRPPNYHESGSKLTQSVIYQQKPVSIQGRIPIYSYKLYRGMWTQPPPSMGKIKVEKADKGQIAVDIPITQDCPVQKGYLITQDKIYMLHLLHKTTWMAKPFANEFLSFDQNFITSLTEHYYYDFTSKKDFSKAEELIKYISLANRVKGQQNSSYNDYYKPCHYEKSMDIAEKLKTKQAVLLLFVGNSLNTIHVQGQSPDYKEINVIRLWVSY